PDGPPVRPGYALASYTAGIFSALGILAALFERDRSGEGQEVDLALYEPLLRFSRDNLPAYQKVGDLRERTGNRSSIALLGLFETRDGRWMALLAPENKDFARLARAMGREELAHDPRFATMVSRRENLAPLNELVANWVRGYDLPTVWEILVQHEVPHSPVLDIQDIFEDPHYQARGNLVEVEDPALGRVRMQDVVPKLSASPGRVQSAGPALGQHNQEVYRSWLGLSEEELRHLQEESVI
ncbi:MAG: CoA transferase, partial [Candidatus Tectomicrobia bacterium]|nr:CoA transferase [Candidatus Tectomicrobia bacterium]